MNDDHVDELSPDWDDDVPTSDEEPEDLGVPHTVEQDQ